MREVNRLLHDEHMHVERLLERLGDLVGRDGARALISPEAGTVAFLGELAGVLEGGLERHFRLEEEDLFPLLEAAGDGDLASVLREDHDILLPLAGTLASWLRQALAGRLAEADLGAARRLALEFVERQVDHIAKEEMALLPALEEALDEERDREIGAAYLAA